MNEEDTLQITETTDDMPSDVSSPIGYVRATRAEKIRNDSSAPDFSVPKVQGLDSIFKDAPVRLTPDEIQDIVKNSGIREGVGTQAAVAMENALIAYNSTDEQLELIGANVENMVTGGKIGDEWRDAAFEMMQTKKELLNINEESIGGVRNWFAKLAGGGTSMLQMVVESYATGGILPILKMGIDALGEGTYNDMQKYYDEHDGSLEGYESKGIDLAVNTMNGFAQAYIERKLGVASPRFLVGWSKGLWKEGVSGAAQEGLQALVGDLSEVAKGNEDVALLLDNAYDYVVTASIGAVLQGPLGAATHGQARARSDRIIASAIAQAKGRTEPLKEDFAAAKSINDAAERQLTSQITTEFKASFDANSGEGKLQHNIANALNTAVKAGELDLETQDETDLAQKIEAIATQETLNALEMAIEQNKSVSEMELNNIVYKDGAIWLEGTTPQVGEKSVDYARVLAARQTGLDQAQKKLDNLNAEIQQTQQDLDAARAASEQGRVERLQKRLDKQKAAEQNAREKAEELQRRADRIQPQIEARLSEQEQAQAQEQPTQEIAPATEMPAVETAVEAQATVVDTQALEELTRAVQDNEIALTKLERAQWEKMDEPQPTQQTPQAQQVAKAERAQFAKQMLDKYKPDWQKSVKPMAQVAQKAQPKPMAKVLEKAAKYKGEKKSLKLERDDGFLHQDDIRNGLTTTKSSISAARKIKGLPSGKSLRLLYDNKRKTWYLADADNKTHIDIFVEAVKQGNYPEINGQREAERAFNENYIADEQTLLSFFAQKFATPEIAKVVMENVLGSDEYTDAYLDGDTVIYARNQYDLSDSGIATNGFDHYQIKYDGDKKSVELVEPRKETGATIQQSKVEGTGSDKYRGGYDEKLKRIILGDKSDLTTIQHEFAHYWIQNNFKWARSGLASQDWLRRWRDVEEALDIDPQDRYLSRRASENFARAYERYIMEGKVADDLKWAFDGFQKFYNDIYEDLQNEYFDLSEELNPAIVDWFNRQRPVTEEQLKADTYKRVADIAMSQGIDVATEVGDGQYVVSSMNKNGEVTSDIVVDDKQAQGSKLAKFRDTQKSRGVIEGLRESNPNIKSDQYNVLNRAETVDQARQWISNDRAGAWEALNSDSTNLIDRTALFQAFKELAENGDYALGAELATIKFPKQMTEVGQALSVLGERAEFDPLTILEMKQKSLGEPTTEEISQQVADMALDVELTAEEVQELEDTTECVL